jgi:hypothetical protein
MLNDETKEILMREEIYNEQKEYIEKIFDYVSKVISDNTHNKDVKKRIKKKTHFVSVCYMAYKAIENGMSVEEFSEKCTAFFNTGSDATTVSDRYNDAVLSKTANADVVSVRKEELEKAFN